MSSSAIEADGGKSSDKMAPNEVNNSPATAAAANDSDKMVADGNEKVTIAPAATDTKVEMGNDSTEAYPALTKVGSN